MKKIVIIAFGGSGVLGGVETYVIRMLEWLSSNGVDAYVMYERKANLAPGFAVEIERLCSKRILLEWLRNDVQIDLRSIARIHLPESSNVHIICFQNPFLLFAAEAIKIANPACTINTFFYAVHYLDFQRNKTRKSQNKVLQNLLKYIYKKLLIKLQMGANIIYMDEYCAEQINENYGLAWEKYVPKIVRLGVKVPPYNEDIVLLRYQNESFNILTIARFDFPYKGYILGLIDEFEQFEKEVPYSVLHIIGDGPGQEALVQKIASKSSALQKKVILHGSIPYANIGTYFDRCKVFIGMGTSLLDASSQSILSITAKLNQTKCLCSGFFFNNIKDIGYMGEIPAAELLKMVSKMSMEEYKHYCRNNYNSYADFYNIDVIMEQLLKHKNHSNKATLSRLDLFILNNGRRLLSYLGRIMGK